MSTIPKEETPGRDERDLAPTEGNVPRASIQAIGAPRCQPARRFRGVTISLICNACGRRFDARRRDAKTCSSSCRQQAYRDRTRPTAIERYASRRGMVRT